MDCTGAWAAGSPRSRSSTMATATAGPWSSSSTGCGLRGEQQSASVMLLRQRMAALRSETKGLTGEIRQFRENRNNQDGSGS